MQELKQPFENAIIHEDIEPLFGSSKSELDKQIIFPDGDHSLFLPKEELQAGRYFDSWNCLAFSLLNSGELYFKYLISKGLISDDNLQWLKDNKYYQYGEINFSDRYTGAKAGTKIGTGNSGRNVKQSVDIWGLVPEVLWSMNKEMHPDEYYIKPPEALDELGKEFQKRFKVNIEGFWLRDIEKVRQYAAPQVFVRAWYRNSKGIYYNTDESKTNHAVLDVKKDFIYDQYEPFIKQLTPDYAYWRTGYFITVQEIISEKTMDIQKFLDDNDLLFVRNSTSGQFGRIMQGKLQIATSVDRGVLMLLDEAVRKNGRTLTMEEWEALPKKNF